ncbi:MAG TPA: beta-ketoacyl-ACP synthase II [Oscillospiraceae bacterium]|nr:beta-ketoacyl-ACP synthase II [Oscillospiraceae bacterium]HPS34386.1 beta-ketoacyl-ACP synthase II [Oscillospiraceae bacterium]
MRRVVVTGMGALTPIGNDVPTFWENLKAGSLGIGPITKFSVEDCKYKLAAQLKDFDALSCLDKNTVRRTDLFVQYALFAAAEAMEDSGLEGTMQPEDLSVVFGSGIGGFETFCAEHVSMLEGGPRKVSPLFVPKMISNIAAGNIAIRYGARNSCLSVTTACATGTTAIGEAFRAIRDGYAEAAICGGSEAAITPLAMAGFTNALALSTSDDPKAASLPFDKRRGGFVMGEGAGALILEEYEHAVRRGAKIYAEVCGYGATCDAYHVTAPAPEPDTAARAVKNALLGSENVDPTRIYVNAHGTGTALNDRCETAAYKKVFGEKAGELHISSTKSMTGHMLGAAGAIEAVAAILALREGIIPPTINLNEPDPDCDLNYTPNKAKNTDLDLSISTSLGFGGHNACIAFRKVV